MLSWHNVGWTWATMAGYVFGAGVLGIWYLSFGVLPGQQLLQVAPQVCFLLPVVCLFVNFLILMETK